MDSAPQLHSMTRIPKNKCEVKLRNFPRIQYSASLLCRTATIAHALQLNRPNKSCESRDMHSLRNKGCYVSPVRFPSLDNFGHGAAACRSPKHARRPNTVSYWPADHGHAYF